MVNKLIEYFSLDLLPRRPHFGAEEELSRELKIRNVKKNLWTIALYFGVFFGVVSTSIIKMTEGQLQSGSGMSLRALMASFVISVVVYPYVFTTAKFDVDQPNIMQVFISFQYGFFWERIIAMIKI
jgi:hypothetical protein